MADKVRGASTGSSSWVGKKLGENFSFKVLYEDKNGSEMTGNRGKADVTFKKYTVPYYIGYIHSHSYPIIFSILCRFN
jgi:hypothetical protein